MIGELVVVAAPLGAAYGTTGYVMARKGWTGLQGALWPFTAAHRVYRKRHPLPVLLSPGAIQRLEAEAGVGPYSVPMVREAYKRMLQLVQEGQYAHCRQPFLDAKDEYFRIMEEYFPAEQPIRTLVWNSGRTCVEISPSMVEKPVSKGDPKPRGWTRIDDRDLIRDMATNLYKQCPTEAMRGSLDAVQRNVGHSGQSALAYSVSVLEWMQKVVVTSGPEGHESYATLEEATERYDELREALAMSLRRGDKLMKTNATERLVRWCCRHHNPRTGRYFPQPGHRDFRPWKEGEEGDPWMDAFSGFQ